MPLFLPVYLFLVQFTLTDTLHCTLRWSVITVTFSITIQPFFFFPSLIPQPHHIFHSFSKLPSSLCFATEISPLELARQSDENRVEKGEEWCLV